MTFSLFATANPASTSIGAAGFVDIGYWWSNTTEANVACPVGVAGVVGSSPRGTRLRANAVGTGRTVTSRKNSAAGTISIAPTDTTAGFYSDTTNTDTLAAGDTFNWGNVSTGTPTYTFIASSFAATTNHAALHTSRVQGAAVTSTSTRYWPLGGTIQATNTTEANAQVTIRQDVTANRFFLRLSANTTASGTSTARLRINGGNGNSVVTFAAGVTGTVSDTTNTDLLANGDLVNISWVNGDANSTTCQVFGYTAENTSGNGTNDTMFSSNGTSLTSTTTQYATVVGPVGPVGSSGTGFGTVEADAKLRHGFGVIASKFRFYVSANATAGSSSAQSRVNGANGNLSISVGSAATGMFEDTTNSDTLLADDDYCWSFTAFDASGITFRAGAFTEQDTTAPYFPMSQPEFPHLTRKPEMQGY